MSRLRPHEASLLEAPLVMGDNPSRGQAGCRRPWGLPAHLLWLMQDGVCRVRVAGGELRAEPGDAVLIEPGVGHVYGSVGPEEVWHCCWAVFQPREHWLPWLSWPSVAGGLRCLRLSEREPIHEALQAAMHAVQQPLPHAVPLGLAHLEIALIHADRQNADRHDAAAAQLDEPLRRAAQLVAEQLDQPLSVEALAEAAGISAAHLTRLFRQQLGVAPRAYVERQRLRRAAELLTCTSLRVEEVARDVGFESPFYFSRRFRLAYGRSPSQYRQRTTGAAPPNAPPA